MQKTKQKVFSPFGIFLSLYIIFLTVLTMAGLIKVYKMVTAYEKSQPDVCINKVINLFRYKNWEELVSLAEVNLCPFEKAEEISENLGNINEENLTFKKKDDFNFLITDGKKELAVVTLKNPPKIDKSGFTPMEIEKVALNLNYWGKARVEAPINSKIMLNGIYVDTQILENKIIKDLQWGIKEESKIVPQKLKYETVAFLNEPEIEVTLNEKPLLKEQQGKIIRFFRKIDKNEEKEVSDFAKRTSMAYANFISNDLKFDDIKDYFLIETDTYRNLQSFYNGWYIEHEGFSFENIEISPIKAQTDNHFVCEVKFNYVVTRPWHKYEYPSDYKIFMVKSNGILKVSSLTVK